VSFISILKQVGTVALGVEHLAAPIIAATVPGAGVVVSRLDNIFSRLQSTIQTVELTNPISAAGPAKAAAVATDFKASLALTQEVLALQGKSLTWDDTTLNEAISAQVAAFNAFAKVKASLQMVDLPK
jgi:hypothetical protein